MRVRKFHNEIHTDDIPAVLRSWERVKLSGWTASLNLSPETGVTCFHILANVAGHLWPPVVAGDELQCLPVSRMSCYSGVMVLGWDAAAQLRIRRHIDSVLETEESIVLRPLRRSDRFFLGPLEFCCGLHDCVLLLALTVSLAN